MEIIDRNSLTQKNEYSQQERPYIIALGNALQKNNVPETYYSLHGYGESCICLQKQGKKWMVFDGEREMKFNTSNYSNIDNACKELINRVADKSNAKKLQKDFYTFLFLLLKTNKNRRLAKTHAQKVSSIMHPSYATQSSQKMVARKKSGALIRGIDKVACINGTRKIAVGVHTSRGKGPISKRTSATIKRNCIKFTKQK